MPFNLLLLPLIGGYLFIHRWNRTRFKALRLDKERLLFHASLAGVFLLLLGFAIEALTPPFIPCIRWFPCFPDLGLPYWGVSSLALLLGWFLPIPLNKIWKFEDESKRLIKQDADAFELLINKALEDTKPIVIVLRNGTVYIGFVVSSFVPVNERQTIHILQLGRGYCDEEQRVHLTANYAKALEEILSEWREWEKMANPVIEGLIRAGRKQVATKLRRDRIEQLEASVNAFSIVIQLDEVVSSAFYKSDLQGGLLKPLLETIM
ncbi:MAG: hypothetical protein WCF57_09350 [Pyrinomonadaceae bacterium]